MNRRARTTSPPSRRKRPSVVLSSVETALWIFSSAMIGLAAWIYADAWMFQSRFRDAVVSPTQSIERSDAAETPVEAGTPIARIEIPRLDLSVIVAEGTTPSVLRQAVGRVQSSARPGENGNIVLAGHRDTFFRPLRDIRPGDLILLQSEGSERAYRVEWTKVVHPDDVRVTDPSRDPLLTLITCYPFSYVGRAPERFVVRARGTYPW